MNNHALDPDVGHNDDEEDDDHDHDDERIQVQKSHTKSPSSTVALSRCWTQKSSHDPFYSGGKITSCHIQPSSSSSSSSSSAQDYFLTPYGGDLCIVNSNTGVKVCTVRKGYTDETSFYPNMDTKKTNTKTKFKGDPKNRTRNEDDDDDDYNEGGEESIDADAILCYTLASNQIDLITASRNQIIRHYHLPSIIVEKKRNAGGAAATIQKTLGKSNHDLPITHMEFHSSSIFFATGGVDGKVKVWDLRGGFITHSFHRNQETTTTSRGGRGSITSLVWCHDMSKLWLAVGRDDGTIQIHDLRRQQQQQDNKGKSSSTFKQSYSDPTCIAQLSDHMGAVTNMIWNPTLDTFITAGRDSVINVWSISVLQEDITKQPLNKEDSLSTPTTTLKDKKNKRSKKDSSSTKMNSSEESKTFTSLMYLYKRIFTHPIYEQVEGMVLLPSNISFSNEEIMSPTDMIVATVGSKGMVRLWKILRDTTRIGSPVTDITLWKQQSVVSSFGEKRGGYMNLFSNHHARVRKPASSSSSSSSTIVDDELLVVDAEHNITCIPLDCAGSTHLTPRRTIVGHNDEILDLKIIPPVVSPRHKDDLDENVEQEQENQPYRIAVATNSPQVRIFDLGTFSSHALDGHDDTVLSIDVSPCGRFLATCGKDKTMRIWLIETSTCVAIARGHTESIGSTAFSRRIGPYDVRGKAIKSNAGAFTVTASNDNTLKRWNLPGASDLMEKSSMILRTAFSSQGIVENNGIKTPVLELRVFASVKAHEKDINIVRVAPNDSLIATGSQDKTVKIWDSNDLILRGTLRGHKRGVWDCQFSPYDKVVATSSGDKTVKLWSLGDFSCVRTFQGHLSSVLRVRFLCGGLQLVSSGSDGLVKLWTIRTNECEGTMDGHGDKIWALDLSSDGTTLVSGGADSRIIVWNDITMEIQEEKREEVEKNVLLEQRLANHLRFKEYKEALDIALELDKPRQALKVFTSIIENDTQDVSSVSIPSTLQNFVSTWSIERIEQVLRFCREWNTRARYSHVAMTIIYCIFATFPANQLIAHESIPEILAGIIPYAERHFDRIDKLSENSYLVDFILSAMGILFNEESEGKDSYATWATASKLVLPPPKQEGASQVKANIISTQVEMDDDVVTVGESTSSDDSD